ncbi:MAG: metal ABC transporter ATP-binding protein [Verrucomicrobiae bacterium]|nr:metal ABC transporter ATP-binding protein [Verrucomicrobiae bacterium]
MSEHQLQIRDLTVSYDRIPAVHHVDMTLRCGHRVGLIGPNGAGKSTLLKAVAGLVPLETGSIRLVGHESACHDHGTAYLPQRSAVDWDFPITVRGLVELGRYPALGAFKRYSEADARAVDEALEALQLTELAERQINALSGGQQQRAFLARAWAQNAHIYLLDEPFTGLDKVAQADLRRSIRALADAGKLVICSHHDLHTVPDLFDEVILINGELVAYGPLAGVFTPASIDKTYGTRIFSGHPPHHPPEGTDDDLAH